MTKYYPHFCLNFGRAQEPHTSSRTLLISVRRVLKSLKIIVLPLDPARVASIVVLILRPIPTATILTSLSCKRNYFDMNWVCIVREGFSSPSFCKGCVIAGLDWVCAGRVELNPAVSLLARLILISYTMQLKAAATVFRWTFSNWSI